MQGLLDGKAAVITGAGSGVGRAAALIFASHGAKLIVADINAVAVEETAAQVRAAGGKALAQACDVSQPAQVDALVAAAVAAYGRLDVMYNNAGITNPPKAGGSRRLTDVAQDEIDLLYRVNVNGVIFGCQAATRQFLSQDANGKGQRGVIVNTASVVGLVGYGSVLYASTKGAITTLTRALAMELAPDGIRVNSVCPSGMPTNFMPGVAGSEAALASMGSSIRSAGPSRPRNAPAAHCSSPLTSRPTPPATTCRSMAGSPPAGSCRAGEFREGRDRGLNARAMALGARLDPGVRR